MGIPLLQIDAFTDRAYRGNPAAVCLLAGLADEAWMQAVAQEMNLSETAFVRRDGAAFDLRWFTPVAEVEMCGHATLASAHVLWELGLLSPDEEARFNTASGLLTATRTGDEIELDFPATPAVETDAPPGLAEPDFLSEIFSAPPRELEDAEKSARRFSSESFRDFCVRVFSTAVAICWQSVR